MIIGLTGSLAAGKGVVADFLKKKGFVYLSLSDELRELAKTFKVEITRKNLQDLGNRMREERGLSFLAELVVNKIKNQEYKKAVIDGIRNPAEIDFLGKNLKNFFLVAVDAPQKIRFERMVSRSRESDPVTWEKFLEVDKKDKGIGEKVSGQGVGKCMKKAKFVLINEGSLEEVNKKVENLFEDLERKLPRPSWDEYFMEISRAVAKRATCNRGRTGCVIAKDKQILVTGYVGSPPGLPHCDEVGHQMKSVIHEDGVKTNHCVRTTHAEQNAICQAARKGISLEGATLYCKLSPCAVCARLLITSGIKELFVNINIK
jgi:dCMP deaminase